MPAGRRNSCCSSAVASLAILLSLGAAMAARPPPEVMTRAAGNGTCQSRVESFGYKCEEHTVRKTNNNNVRHRASRSCDRCRPNFSLRIGARSTLLPQRLITTYCFSGGQINYHCSTHSTLMSDCKCAGDHHGRVHPELAADPRRPRLRPIGSRQ